MSKTTLLGPRPTFASKTAYDILGVDDVDESEEEDVPEQPSSDVDAKPSKAAIKRAKRLARIEQKQQEKALARQRRREAILTSEGEATPSESNSVSRPDSALNIVEALSENESEIPSQSVELPLPPPVVEEQLEIRNGIKSAAKNEITPTEELDIPNHSDSAVQQISTSLPTEKPSQNAAMHTGQASLDVSSVEQQKKRQNIVTRTLWTFIMIGGFIGLLLLGHAYMVLLVMLCQTLVYREVTALFSLRDSASDPSVVPSPKKKDPWSKTLNWYFFAVTNYFLYGESIIYYFKHVVFADAQLLPFATNHRIISFTLYTIGFMGFVMSLKKGYLKQQFGLFCWVHMSLLLIVISSHFIVNNILEGLIWFWVPASLVICNDVFAYIWGMAFGRTPLIKLSPKKTVEGFVGAFWSTLIFGVLWGSFFMRFDYMICPVHDLGVSAWSSTHCTPNPVFIWTEWHLSKPVAAFLSTLLGRAITTISYAPYQLHLLFMSIFASLVAPFGGFFASGFKRAFNIKDFGHSIPGHGGMTDRMDCQFLMGIFTYVYYSSLIREHHVTVGSILQTIVSGLTVDQQLELIADLKRYLERQGINVP